MNIQKTILILSMAATVSACDLGAIQDTIDDGLNGAGNKAIDASQAANTKVFGDKTYTVVTEMVTVDGVETEQVTYEPVIETVSVDDVVFIVPVAPPVDAVIVLAPDPDPVIVAPAPVVVAPPVVIRPVPRPVDNTPLTVVEPEPEPEIVIELDTPIDPDGETIFTIVDTSNNTWTRPRPEWIDSYSVGNRCYIASELGHGIKDVVVDTPYGKRTIENVAQLLGAGPGVGDNPQYNDVQCGNGPANDFGDEDIGQCSGRIDQGAEGCGVIGPKWYFES